MWFPTQDEAVELYARFLAARHGSAAERHARRTAERLQAEGDQAGHDKAPDLSSPGLFPAIPLGLHGIAF